MSLSPGCSLVSIGETNPITWSQPTESCRFLSKLELVNSAKAVKVSQAGAYLITASINVFAVCKDPYLRSVSSYSFDPQLEVRLLVNKNIRQINYLAISSMAQHTLSLTTSLYLSSGDSVSLEYYRDSLVERTSLKGAYLTIQALSF